MDTIPKASHEKGDVNIQDYSKVDYREFWKGFSKSYLDKKEKYIIQKLIPPVSGWFIDLGCGYGRLLPAYLKSNRQIVMGGNE